MSFNLGTWQILMIVMVVLNLCEAAYAHGKPREPLNFGLYIFSITLGQIILIMGGFYQ